MTKACVIGHPIAHSLSPVLHSYWIEKYQITGEYSKVDVAPGDLSLFLNRLRSGEFAGCNVTIPHKENVIEFVDQKTDIVNRLGAANTLWMEGTTLWADNTDGFGFMSHLDASQPNWRDTVETALIIGAGGASRAIIDALCQSELPKIIIANRTIDRAKSLIDHFKTFWPNTKFSASSMDSITDHICNSDVIINTSSLGMKGQPELSLDLSSCAAHTIIYDLVYNPLQTPLLAEARKCNLKTVDGLGMLLHQGRPGFEKWFGHFPHVTDNLYTHIHAQL